MIIKKPETTDFLQQYKRGKKNSFNTVLVATIKR